MRNDLHDMRMIQGNDSRELLRFAVYKNPYVKEVIAKFENSNATTR